MAASSDNHPSLPKWLTFEAKDPKIYHLSMMEMMDTEERRFLASIISAQLHIFNDCRIPNFSNSLEGFFIKKQLKLFQGFILVSIQHFNF